jgi:hypothetical protein
MLLNGAAFRDLSIAEVDKKDGGWWAVREKKTEGISVVLSLPTFCG